MKIPTILFCFLPWIAMALGLLLTKTVYVPTNLTMTLVELMWLALSPLVVALGLLVAYREGQRSMEKTK